MKDINGYAWNIVLIQFHTAWYEASQYGLWVVFRLNEMANATQNCQTWVVGTVALEKTQKITIKKNCWSIYVTSPKHWSFKRNNITRNLKKSFTYGFEGDLQWMGGFHDPNPRRLFVNVLILESF